jgi:outer membrane biosynthesis protein TonB
MREMKLTEARKHVEAGKLEEIAIAWLDGWPGDVRLTVTVSEELAAEIDLPPTSVVSTSPIPPAVDPVPPAPVVDTPKPGRKPKVINQEENQATPPAPAPVEPPPAPAPTPEPVAEEPAAEEEAEEEPA